MNWKHCGERMMNLDFGISDLLMIFATFFGPIAAVQAQKYLERLRQKDESQRKIFTILMITRNNKMSLEHINALNSVPIEFYGKNAKLKEVCELWRRYIELLSTKYNDQDSWSEKLNEIYNYMLAEMAKILKYDFTYTQISKEGYFPQGYNNVENEQFLLRLGMMELLNGKRKIKIEIYDGSKNRDSQGAETP